jgi:hypothetical protein
MPLAEPTDVAPAEARSLRDSIGTVLVVQPEYADLPVRL